MAAAEPITFGKYQLIKRLAMGGMAEIFLARLVGASGFSRELVVKRIHPEFSEDDEFVRMFTNEAKVAALLHHPNIVQVLDFDAVDGTYYIAMERVDGADLKRTILLAHKQGLGLPYQLALWVSVQALKGLSHAHRLASGGEACHIVHRDVSPHNILLSMQGEVKVTDFGIARVMQQASLTASGVLKGKVSYMAPEQTFSSNVDQRADVFAMGVIVWELLCRRRLFQASNDLLVVEKVRKSDIPAPHIVNPAIPEELSEVVMSALARELDARVPDAATFQQQLKPWLWVPTANEELARFMQQLLAGGLSPSDFSLLDDFQAPVFGAISATSLPSVQEDVKAPLATPKRGTAQLAGWSPPTPGEAQDPKGQEPDESTGSDSLPSVLNASEEEKVPIAASTHGWMIRTEAMPSASSVVAGMYDGKFGARSEDAHAPDDPSIVSTVQVKPAELLQSFGHLDPLAKTRLDPEDPDDLITEELLKRGYDPAVERSPLPPGAVSNDPTVEVNPALHLGDLSKLVPVTNDDALPTEQENVLAYAPTGSVQKFSADELESMVKEVDGEDIAKNSIWRWLGLGVLLLSLVFLLYFLQFR